ncbi:hypothetical protein DENSPDRAFT_831386 [Dentipellis sp. KUC8613]|nr:hypothetical protein DENSPDRAFT_831386 [Dentipellis sp. KUC8613]
MKVPALLLAAAACVAPCSAQYFSAGWKPGQAVPSETPSPITFDPKNPPVPVQASGKKAESSGFSLTNIISSGPVADLLGRAGINVTQSLQAIQNASESRWDKRIPMIHDDNYQQEIVDEVLTEEEEKSRVWFLVISVTTTQHTSLSSYVDEQFDAAYNLTQQEQDLPNVKWGRIDYINVTEITTRWSVWQAPMLVVLTDRGQTLRFYRASQLQIKPDTLRQFLKGEYYLRTAPWKSAFAPGGKREFVLVYLGIVLRKIYDVVSVLPRWVLYIATGSIGSIVVNLLHRGQSSARPAQRPQTQPPAQPAQVKADSETAASESPKSSKGSVRNKGKKGGKGKN